MYKLALKITFFFLLISFSTISSYAQKDCDERILNAQKLYDAGKYNQVIINLVDVLNECNLKGNKKYEVLKYLAAANYELDELEEANKYMMSFLKKMPYYDLNLNSDPGAFLEHIDYFKKWPLIEVGLNGGIPFNNIITDKIYPVLDTAITDYNQDFYTKSAYLIGIDLTFNINNYIAVSTGGNLIQQEIAQTIPMFQGIDFNYSEKMKQINIPLSFKFSFPIKNFTPSIYFGGELIYMLNSEYYYDYTENGTYDEKYEFLILRRKRSDVFLDMDTERNQMRYAAIGGVQLAYKIKKISIFARFKYRKELDYFNNSDFHYTKQDLYITNYYVFPDIHFESYEATIGFTYSLFYKIKPKY